MYMYTVTVHNMKETQGIWRFIYEALCHVLSLLYKCDGEAQMCCLKVLEASWRLLGWEVV